MSRPDAAYELVARDPEGLTRDELTASLRASAKVRAWLDARDGRVLRAIKALEPDPADPARDEADRLRREQNLNRGEANKRATAADQLGHLPETEEALESGDITGEHASVLADARAKADAAAKAALAASEAELLAAARDESPNDFRKRVERFVAEHSAHDGLADHDRRKARNSLRFWKDRDGMKRLSGAFDPDLGAAIEAEVRRKAEERWRAERAGRTEVPVPESIVTNEGRMAEALGDICGRSQGADVRDGKRVRPRMGITMTLDQLFGRDDRPAERADGTPVPASVARKMACVAGLVPIVLGGDSVPLDWGRAHRYAQPQQNEALRLQDDTCTLFGCTMNIEWADAHHVDEFQHGGPTDLANLAPACDHCHDLVHRPGWGCAKDEHGVITSWSPSGQLWIIHPRDRRRRPVPHEAAASDIDQDDGSLLV